MRNGSILVVVAVLGMATGQEFGLIQYKDGGTHNINSTINEDVWVDYQAPGMQTTVNLLRGGVITKNYVLQADDEQEIKRLMKHIAPGGGYVFSSSNAIHSGSSPETYNFVREKVLEYGTYPIIS